MIDGVGSLCNWPVRVTAESRRCLVFVGVLRDVKMFWTGQSMTVPNKPYGFCGR